MGHHGFMGGGECLTWCQEHAAKYYTDTVMQAIYYEAKSSNEKLFKTKSHMVYTHKHISKHFNHLQFFKQHYMKISLNNLSGRNCYGGRES
jgi:hypothetical protein